MLIKTIKVNFLMLKFKIDTNAKSDSEKFSEPLIETQIYYFSKKLVLILYA